MYFYNNTDLGIFSLFFTKVKNKNKNENKNKNKNVKIKMCSYYCAD